MNLLLDIEGLGLEGLHDEVPQAALQNGLHVLGRAAGEVGDHPRGLFPYGPVRRMNT